MKIYPYPWSTRCWICHKEVSLYRDSNHFHTLRQVLRWLWDGHLFWRIGLVAALFSATVTLVTLVLLVVKLLAGGHSLLYVIGGPL